MMELTRKGDYAIRGIIYLASQPPNKISLLSEIAVAVDVPQTFLAKIFQQFSKTGIVKSFRGTGGGFLLAGPPESITLLQVVEAVEGPILPNRCVLKPGECERDASCTVHPVWRQVQQQVRSILAGITLKDLATL
ncbi:RrF2 family transcriptional regulator [Trichlorobacter lovleyi]|uniref:Transcriptional regulator, BadM/Rrf2 family n=1 Tax=Trichlorobacter lovleyi (strain ATCC BAA-1151 / DSM 17278 / SZ) TaxID=398767 RepID=B3E783_TRIL1|nr:Rrf2 family transcriptional regulator [Trichlorobacter lovleyi]ACD94963.1 transcriptional regulator, BadM/Rrf2 family [Trichlorobacter lovleyi SZ]QOX78361.1 Rrf2 family transcriptional regulator [Trichlorobacter lovleyi]